MIENRLRKNLKSRSSFLKQENTNCFRLYELDIPEYPFIVDIYGDFAVVWPKLNPKLDKNPKEKISEITKAIEKVFSMNQKNIFIKERQRKKGKEQYEKLFNYQGKNTVTTLVQENGIQFQVNLSDYLDCGLFMDHRPLRKNISKMKGAGKTFLNIFSYTCSVSVVAALASFKTTSVDLSNTYLNWGKENFSLNNLKIKDHQFIKESALDYLSKEQENQFDLIFLDPPTFSNSKSMEKTFEVEKDQKYLISHCMKLLKQDGVLYFSNNKTTFQLLKSINENFAVKDISLKSIPNDFRNKKVHHLFEIRHQSV